MNRRRYWFLTAASIVVLVLLESSFPGAARAQVMPRVAGESDGPPIVQVRHVRWTDLEAAGQALPGEIVSDPNASPSGQLVVEVSKQHPVPVHLLTLDDPGVGPPAYVLRGSVKCENVDAPGYLEMWNYFPDGSYFFTRTLASVGPMAALQGTGDWRPIELPFFIHQPDAAAREKMRPNKLEVNLVLPAGGKIYLSNLELAQYDDKAPAVAALTSTLGSASGAWWSPRTAGIAGGVLGSIVGAWGALIGILASLGRTPRLVKGLLFGCTAFGAMILALGAMALLLGQPWSVGGTLAMVGLPAMMVPILLLPTVNRHSQERELRRMQALDVGV
ncbi:MAG: hypothetical protein KF708_23255 [Pirellulales bacterium]|nr:hypothetical protein [Pirellulales bacterium]